MTLGTEEKRAWLAHVELFHGCPPESLTRVADRTSEAEFAPGQHIVQQGQIGNGLYIVVRGAARAARGDTVIARLGPGTSSGSCR